jgi:hypothetical protein
LRLEVVDTNPNCHQTGCPRRSSGARGRRVDSFVRFTQTSGAAGKANGELPNP